MMNKLLPSCGGFTIPTDASYHVPVHEMHTFFCFVMARTMEGVGEWRIFNLFSEPGAIFLTAQKAKEKQDSGTVALQNHQTYCVLF